MPPETAQTLDRGLRALAVLAHQPDGLTVTDLAARLEVNRTVVHRLVATLQQHALVRRDDRGRLRLGLGVLTMAAAVLPALRESATPVLRDLAEAVGCTAHLTIADGETALALAVVEPSWTDYHVAYRVGARHPLERGAAGRAILLARAGDPRPYVLTRGELQTGARGMAAPVRSLDGLEASVGVVTLTDLVPDDVAPALTRAADRIAGALRG